MVREVTVTPLCSWSVLLSFPELFIKLDEMKCRSDQTEKIKIEIRAGMPVVLVGLVANSLAVTRLLSRFPIRIQNQSHFEFDMFEQSNNEE